MTASRLIIGDVRDVMATMPDASVDLVLTSPPFLALRSYLPANHPDKHREIGSEPTPAAFIQTLLELTADWRRLLAPHGSICVELGDTYSGSGGAGGDYAEGGLREGQQPFDGSAAAARDDRWGMNPATEPNGRGKQVRPGGLKGEGWPMPKSMCGIPHLYHLSLAYGRNLLTGEPSPAGQWRIRNIVAWCRPNPPVGALGDKFRPATSYMTIATIAGDRYFDIDAVRGDPNPNTHARTAKGVESRPNDTKHGNDARTGGNRSTLPIQHSSAGAPPLDWWEIPTQPYAGSHYAVFPPALLTRPIEAMCPRQVCTTCGQPSRRIAETTNAAGVGFSRHGNHGAAEPGAARNGDKAHDQPTVTERTTLGWTDCGHNTWRRGLVLDPFAGSGTTLAVATGHGRDAIGIDIDARNADLVRDRCGMFLEISEPEPTP